MQKSKRTKAIQLLVIMFPALICFRAYAQKLPSTQQISLWAPDHIKIDGNAAEWDNKYQAYNKANHLYYSIANDDKNLYLVIRSSDKIAIQKMVRWGVALTINAAGNKKLNDKSNVTVSFPFADRDKNLVVIHSLGRNDNALDQAQLVKMRNDIMGNMFKLITVSGIKDISTPEISVYNDKGIKAAALFDDNVAYVYELAIPLKYLNVPDNETMFSYNIKLNGGNINPTAPMAPTKVMIGPGGSSNPDQDYLNAPTDFWGEYTLAKNKNTTHVSSNKN